MLFPVVLSLVGLLLIVTIGYNVIQQYKQKIEADNRLAISKQRAVITEVDELLLNATRIPFSKSLLLILQNRIRNALINMIQRAENNTNMREHLQNIDEQILQIKSNYTAPDDSVFHSPENDREALALLQVIKKIRAVLRSEHTKGKINTQEFIIENQKLESMQLKINLENGFKRIIDAKEAEQFGSANQMINKLIKILNDTPDKDAYLNNKLTQLQQIKQEIKTFLATTNDKELAALKAKDTEKKSDLDILFQEKKKW